MFPSVGRALRLRLRSQQLALAVRRVSGSTTAPPETHGHAVHVVGLLDASVFPDRWSELERRGPELARHGAKLTLVSDAGCGALAEALASANAVAIGTKDKALLAAVLDPTATPELRWVHTLSAGADQLPLAGLKVGVHLFAPVRAGPRRTTRAPCASCRDAASDPASSVAAVCASGLRGRVRPRLLQPSQFPAR